jgi:Transglutaminase-like superfamily
MSWRADLSRFRGATWTERGLVIEALAWLAVLRLAIAALPFRRVASLVRLKEAADLESPQHSPSESGARIGWAVRAAAARTPWLSTCLAQSLTGLVMLRRHGVASTVYLGVAKDGAGEFVAHSWLRCGDAVLTGSGGHKSFSIIAAYCGQSHACQT